MLPNSGEKGKFFQVANCSESVALGLARVWQEGCRYQKLTQWKYTIMRFRVETWSESKLTCYEMQTTPFLTLCSATSCSQHDHCLHQPSLCEMPLWGSEAAAVQHVAWTPWVQQDWSFCKTENPEFNKRHAPSLQSQLGFLCSCSDFSTSKAHRMFSSYFFHSHKG